MNTPHQRHRGRGFPRERTRGSLLIVAMIIAAIIGVSLVSYIKLSTNSLTLADRSFYQTSAMNLTEIGIEEAMYCYNRLDDMAAAAAWNVPADAGGIVNVTWVLNGSTATGTLRTFTLGPNVTGSVKVYCSNYDPGNDSPIVVAKATVTLPQGPALEKWVLVQLRKRSLWANGMVARNTVVWNGGNSTADAWDSSGTPPVPYSSGVATANVTIGSPTGANGAIDVGGGTIRGEILSAGGTILSSSGAILSDSMTGTGWDASLVSSDFDANFPSVSVPEPPTASLNRVSDNPITFGSSLPRTGIDQAWNGTYYYYFGNNEGLSSNVGTLTISGPVVFLATANAGYDTLNLGGTGSIEVATSGKLQIFTNGDIKVAGGGIANSTSVPSSLQIYGTNTTVGQQTIYFRGIASSIGAIYAPNATFELRGNGAMQGAVVANTINLNGNARFSYDVALKNTNFGNPYGIVLWRELQTADERSTYAAHF